MIFFMYPNYCRRKCQLKKSLMNSDDDNSAEGDDEQQNYILDLRHSLNLLQNIPAAIRNSINFYGNRFSISNCRLWLVTRIVDIVAEYAKFIRNSQRTFTTYRHVGIECFVEKFTSNYCQLWANQWKDDGIGHIAMDNNNSIGALSITDSGWSQKANEWNCDEHAPTTNWMCFSISNASVEFAAKFHLKRKPYVGQ